MKRRWVIPIIAFALLSCGGPKTRPPTRTANTQGRQSRSIPQYDAKPEVADQTRKATQGRRGSWGLTSDKVTDVAEFVKENSAKYRVPEDLLFGIIWVESRFDTRAVSPVGARGLMQLMPNTAKYLGDCIGWDGRKNAFDPKFNIAAGSYYIARLIGEFGGDEDLALAAYNAGPARVRQWLASKGLPDISVEYAAMVQTARTFFGGERSKTQSIGPSPAFGRDSKSVAPRQPNIDSSSAPASPAPVITDEELDRLGLTILIAGLSSDKFKLEKEDSENPFN